MKTENSIMTPREIVEELDQYIVGQKAAKKSVALALRNRYRRMNLSVELKKEVTPKNILMIGPTGVGKTEIARRLATLSNAPFIKVEATKFTEVGYVGKEVDSIIRDLAEISVKLVRDEAVKKQHPHAEKEALEQVLNILLPGTESEVTTLDSDLSTREKIRKKVIRGEMDDTEIEVSLPSHVGVEVMAPPGMEEMSQLLSGLSTQLGQLKHKKRKVKVKEAISLLTEIEAAKRVNEEEIKTEALTKVQESGMVFIDEIDKICKGSEHNADVNREGVQRDLLPLIEGCTVNTKYGVVNTDHILFITSGAFHISKPSDLIPELQGRLPVRVELDELTIDDFTRILTEPRASLICQYQALMKTENVDLSFDDDAIIEIAKIAFDTNKKIENIGARRLQTVMEKLLEDISFSAGEKSSDSFNIDVSYVRKQLGAFTEDEDLSRYML